MTRSSVPPHSRKLQCSAWTPSAAATSAIRKCLSCAAAHWGNSSDVRTLPWMQLAGPLIEAPSASSHQQRFFERTVAHAACKLAGLLGCVAIVVPRCASFHAQRSNFPNCCQEGAHSQITEASAPAGGATGPGDAIILGFRLLERRPSSLRVRSSLRSKIQRDFKLSLRFKLRARRQCTRK